MMKQRINRISVTHLDQFQYFLDSDMSEAELYERLYGGFTETPAIAAGVTLHKLLENGILPHNQTLNGFHYVMAEDIEGDIVIGEEYEREIKHVVSDLVDGVDLVGILDVDAPRMIIDHKLTGSYKPERYMNAWQWRAYLTMTGKDHFRYQVFECRRVENYDQIVYIKDYHAIDTYRYEGMEDDVKSMIQDLSDLIDKWRSEGLSCKREYQKR